MIGDDSFVIALVEAKATFNLDCVELTNKRERERETERLKEAERVDSIIARLEVEASYPHSRPP